MNGLYRVLSKRKLKIIRFDFYPLYINSMNIILYDFFAKTTIFFRYPVISLPSILSKNDVPSFERLK